MDSLLAELDRKRKQLDSNTVTAKKKYFKRSELSEHQASEYKRKQEEKLKAKDLLSDDRDEKKKKEEEQDQLRYKMLNLIRRFTNFLPAVVFSLLVEIIILYSLDATKHKAQVRVHLKSYVFTLVT